MLDEKMTRLTPLRLWILLVKVKKKTRECLLDRCLEDGTSSPLTSQPDTTPSPAAEARLWGAWRASTSCTPSLRWDWDTSLPAPFPDVPPVCRRPLPSPEAPPLGDTVCSAGETRIWEEGNLYFSQAKELAVFLSQVLQDRQLLSNKALHLFLQTRLSMEVLFFSPSQLPPTHLVTRGSGSLTIDYLTRITSIKFDNASIRNV